MRAVIFVLSFVIPIAATPLRPQNPRSSATSPNPTPSDSVTIRIVGAELRTAVQIMQQYLDRPVIFSATTGGMPVTFETPRPVPRGDVPRLLRALLESQGYELVTDTAYGTYRVRAKEQL